MTDDNSKLIKLNINGQTVELWGLLNLARDKRQQWQHDFDYIHDRVDPKTKKVTPGLVTLSNSDDPKQRAEATAALLYLNAAAQALYDSNFKGLQKQGVDASKSLKKAVYDARNAAQRDFSAYTEPLELTDEVLNKHECYTISEIVEQIKHLKTSLRQVGKSIAPTHQKRLPKKKQPKPTPVKKYNKEELEEFKKQYEQRNKSK